MARLGGHSRTLISQSVPKRVSLWGQFVRLAAAAIGIFAAVAVAWYLVDSKLAATTNEIACTQKRDLFKKLIDLQGRDLEALLDSATHEANLALAEHRKPSFAPSISQTEVFLVDHNLSSVTTSGNRLSDLAGLEGNRRLSSTEMSLHFYTWNQGSLEEFRMAQVGGASDSPANFVVAKRIWTPAKLSFLSSITESQAKVVGPTEPQPAVTDEAYTVALPLKGMKGEPVAELRFSVRTDDLNSAISRNRMAGVFLVLLMIGLTSALMATVVRKLVAPLGKLARGLQDHDPHIGETFQASPTEILQLAEAISHSFHQKSELDGLNKTLASTIESLNEANGQLSSYNEALEQRVSERTRDIAQAIETTIFGWSKAMDSRDHETEGHTRRVAEMAQALGEQAGLDADELRNLKFGALLHDIGKIGIPDSILLKPGKLTEGEFEVMRSHTTLGYAMLKDIPFLEDAVDVVLYHHERWDGGGYPYGLKGEEIPFAARLFAIADVWDALRSDRPYREAWSEEKTRQYIHEQAGLHFDPELVKLYLSIEPIKHPSDRKTQRKAA